MKTLEIQIVSLSSDGTGIGRDASGRVVFVANSAPGDRLRVQVDKENARFLYATITEILEASPSRIEPRCKFFRRCGGCDWQHVAYATQCAEKQKRVRDALERVGKLVFPESIEFTPSPQEYGYRARTRLVVHAQGLGYRARGSKQVCVVEECPILHPALEKVLHNLMSNQECATGWRSQVRGGEVEIACGVSSEVRVVDLATKRVLHGPERIALDARGCQVEISPGGFFQGNSLLWTKLLDSVSMAVGRGARALELFAGAGFFTLGIADQFEALIAVESDPQAIADLHRNLRQAARTQVTPLASPVENLASFEAVRRFAPEVLLLDPPRVGLSPRARKQVLALQAPRIVYLSCDPASLARDLSEWVSHGYTLKSVEAFDLFPQTPHVETLVCLEKAEGAAEEAALSSRS